MIVIRPADANEMIEAYRFVLRLKNRPAALICTRQALPIVDRSQFAPASGLAKAPICSSMPQAGQAGRDPDRLRQRSIAVSLRRGSILPPKILEPASSACRHGSSSMPRNQAYQQSVLPSDGDGEGHGRGSLTNRLGAICWAMRRGPRDARLRHVGADEGRGGAFRLRGGACGSRRQKYHPPRGGRNELAR